MNGRSTRQVLYGTTVEEVRWRECVSYVNSNMESAVGSLYVREAFPRDSKDAVGALCSVCLWPLPTGTLPVVGGGTGHSPPPHRVTPGSQCQDPAGPPAARVCPGDTGEHTFAWCPVTWGGQRPHPQPYRPVLERPTGHTGCESRGGQALGSPRRTPSSQDPCPGRGGAFHTPSPNITAGTRLWTDPCRDPNAGHTG